MDKEKVIYEDDVFYVESSQGRYYLNRKGSQDHFSGWFGQLINGQKGLDKYYKGDFKVWIRKILEKEIKVSDENIERIKNELDGWYYRLNYADIHLNNY